MTNDVRMERLDEFAAAFLSGKSPPLETALMLHSIIPWDEAPQNLQNALLSVAGIVSEMDDIALGERRGLWHEDVRTAEDRKHDEPRRARLPSSLKSVARF